MRAKVFLGGNPFFLGVVHDSIEGNLKLKFKVETELLPTYVFI